MTEYDYAWDRLKEKPNVTIKMLKSLHIVPDCSDLQWKELPENDQLKISKWLNSHRPIWVLGKDRAKNAMSVKKSENKRFPEKYPEKSDTVFDEYETKKIPNIINESTQRLFNKICDKIKSFELNGTTPTGEKPRTMALQYSLARWFPECHVTPERQTGTSIPDIVIDNLIPIEVKYNSGNDVFNNIDEKCDRYLKNYNCMIVVMFKPRFDKSSYDKFVAGIRRKHGNVIQFILK